MVGLRPSFRPMYAKANMGHPSLTSASFAACKFRPLLRIMSSVLDLGLFRGGHGITRYCSNFPSGIW